MPSSPSSNNLPKAYINWILFDEHFQPVLSGFQHVGSAEIIVDHSQSIAVTRNGYLYAYCSNESGRNVFFDNFQVVHVRGPLLAKSGQTDQSNPVLCDHSKPVEIDHTYPVFFILESDDFCKFIRQGVYLSLCAEIGCSVWPDFANTELDKAMEIFG